MTSRERAPSQALVPTEVREVDPVAAAQARLAEVLAEVASIDAEVEALSATLAAFAVEVERRLAAPDAEARRASSSGTSAPPQATSSSVRCLRPVDSARPSTCGRNACAVRDRQLMAASPARANSWSAAGSVDESISSSIRVR
jgi:hypothetical protein